MNAKLSSHIAIAVTASMLALAAGHAMAAAANPTRASEVDPGVPPEDRLKRNKVSALRGKGDAEFVKAQSLALAGNGEAAMRVAQMFADGSNGVPRDEGRKLQWLLHASSLNNAAASYRLYQHYLEHKLDRDAIFFENRAREQGFVPPPRLDPRRG
jgi:TPR repeat protein